MFDDAIRLIRILQLIPKNRPIDTQEIQEELRREGIDLPIRTLQRYLQTIRATPPPLRDRLRRNGARAATVGAPNAKGSSSRGSRRSRRCCCALRKKVSVTISPRVPLNGLRPMLRTAKRNLAPTPHAPTPPGWRRSW